MRSPRSLVFGGWMMVGVVAGFSQDVVSKVAKPAPDSGHVKEIRFRDGKPVLGLSMVSLDHATVNCAPNGLVYLSSNPNGASSSSPDLLDSQSVYSVSLDGETKTLLWKRPPAEFDDVKLLDLFATADKLVSLFAAAKTNSGNRPDTSYFLSITGQDNDGSKLLSLDVKFRPLKIAMFASGELLLLGWDRGNEIPVLALLKDDGSLRRFVDLDNRTAVSGLDPFLGKGMAGRPSGEALQALENARFTAFGGDVILGQEGGTAPLHHLDPFGGDSRIPIQYPGGFVLHDVLASDVPWTVVLRLEPKGDQREWAKSRDTKGQELFEFNARYGTLVSTLKFDKPEARDVTCAPGRNLAAIFRQAVPGQSQQSVGLDGNTPPPAMQWVVTTASH